MNQTGAPLEAFFDLRLIALSFLIAIFASCVALDFAVRIMVGRGAVRHGWLTRGAILMGVGIWSRPFAGMRAARSRSKFDAKQFCCKRGMPWKPEVAPNRRKQ